MVEVVTSKDFDEFKKDIEERLYTMGGEHEKRLDASEKRLDASEKKIEDLVKDVDEKYKRAKVDLDKALKVLNTRIDDVEESSKSFVVRLKEAITPPKPESHEG